jgi:LysR family hydrogen peroxide-inducible transcriptional activator
MQLSQIRYFLAVAETLNFTKAARVCAVSQPALSKAIRNLEADLGA